MRLFIGIKTGCEDYLAALQDELKKRGRGNFTHTENLHITLKFLGETPFQSVNGISAAMSEIAFKPFSLKCLSVKVFNRNGIVSAEVDGDLAALSSLAEKLEDALEAKGFAKETRHFRPHITLAREYRMFPGKSIESIPHAGCPFDVSEIILFESTRQNGRLVYVPVYSRKLG